MQFGILRRTPVRAIAVASALSYCLGCAFLPAKPVGFPLYVASAPTIPCGDGYDLWVLAQGNHRFSLNDNSNLDMNELTRRLREILVHRAEKVIYVRGGPDVSYQDFVEMVDGVYRKDSRFNTDGRSRQKELEGWLPDALQPINP